MQYRSPREFASALMRSGTSTERARELLRASRPYFARMANAQELRERQQEAQAYRREVNRDATAMAADKVLRECGFAEERDDDWINLYYLE